MGEGWRLEEVHTREEAQAHAGEIVEGSGSRGKPRRMAQMVSVRLDGELIAMLRAIAKEREMTLTDVLKEAAKDLVRKSLEDKP